MFTGLLRACTIGSFDESLVSNLNGPIKCASRDNQTCQAKLKLVDINSSKSFFYLFAVIVNKCDRRCNAIDDPYVRVFVSNKVKNINVKLLNLMAGVNKTRFLVQHELCKCKYGLNESVCNTKQKLNHDKFQ